MCFRVRFIIKQVDVLILPKVIVTFVLSMTSIAFLSSVNDFVMLLLFVWFSSAPTCIACIENTSWKVLAYGIYARVVHVSEIERVRAANEYDFWYKNNECVNTVQSTFHVVLCLLYTYRDIHHFGGLFILNLSKMLICRYTLAAKWQRKRSISFLVKTFVKNRNDGEDMM